MASDNALRQGVRGKIEPWIKKLQCDGDVEQQWFYKKKFIDRLRNSPIAESVDKPNEQHYEVPTEFYLTILGKRLKYSCCCWPKDTKTLEEAEDVSLEIICARARVEDGQTILDLGCGWGALALWICEKYPNCKVVAVSNSSTQRELIQTRASGCGYGSRLECITADANFFSTEDKFDRIISIEMFEHMRNYEKLFAKCASWLKPDGMLFTQILCHKEFAYAFDTKEGSDTEWMASNYFTAGTMPSADLFAYFQNDVCLIDHWRINGKQYMLTLEDWLRRLDENIGKVTEIMNKTYGPEEAPRHLYNWRLFFIFCSEVFNYKDGNEWIVAHHLFRRR